MDKKLLCSMAVRTVRVGTVPQGPFVCLIIEPGERTIQRRLLDSWLLNYDPQGYSVLVFFFTQASPDQSLELLIVSDFFMMSIQFIKKVNVVCRLLVLLGNFPVKNFHNKILKWAVWNRWYEMSDKGVIETGIITKLILNEDRNIFDFKLAEL